jgi:gas vesicle protein
MFIKLNARKGQNTAEYAILIGVIVAAAIAMQIYIRRGMQARIRDAVDYSRTGENNELSNFFSNDKQYEPYYLSTNFTTSQSGDVAEMQQQGGGVVRDSIADTTTRYGNQAYTNYVEGNT